MRLKDKNAIVTGAASGIGRAIAVGYAREGRAHRRKLLERNPMGPPAEPDEMVGAAVFLASDEASYVTGVSLAVDGGYSVV